MKTYYVTIHHKMTLVEIGMACVQAQTSNAARDFGAKLIEKEQNLGRLDPSAYIMAAYEVFSPSAGH